MGLDSFWTHPDWEAEDGAIRAELVPAPDEELDDLATMFEFYAEQGAALEGWW